MSESTDDKSINDTLNVIRQALQEDNSNTTKDTLILNQLIKNDGTIVSINIDNKKEVKKVFSEVLEPHFDKWLSKHLPNYLDKYNLNKEK